MRLLVCRVGGLADTLSMLPLLDALTTGFCGAQITVLCAQRCAGLVSMTMPGVRVVGVDDSAFSGPKAMLKVPAIVRQVGQQDKALIAPGEPLAVYSIARLTATQRVGFACGLSRAEGFLTQTLPYDPHRAVPDVMLDLARDLLDWPRMPLSRIAPLGGAAALTSPGGGWLPGTAVGGDEEDWACLEEACADFDLPAEWEDSEEQLPGSEAVIPDAPYPLAASAFPFAQPRSGVIDRYGVIHPGAGDSAERWGVERFSQVLPMLQQATGLPWVLVDETAYDLIDLAALLAGAEMFVGCHSGPLQLAAAQGIPWVAIGGPTSVAWDPPWTDVPGMVVRAGLDCQPCAAVDRKRPGHCGQSAACLAAVDVDMVVEAVRQVRHRATNRVSVG